MRILGEVLGDQAEVAVGLSLAVLPREGDERVAVGRDVAIGGVVEVLSAMAGWRPALSP